MSIFKTTAETAVREIGELLLRAESRREGAIDAAYVRMAIKPLADALATVNDDAIAVESMARALVMAATAHGLVLTIEQRPLQPLAIGNYETVVSVRPARGNA